MEKFMEVMKKTLVVIGKCLMFTVTWIWYALKWCVKILILFINPLFAVIGHLISRGNKNRKKQLKEMKKQTKLMKKQGGK